jgi:hypothetical protein
MRDQLPLADIHFPKKVFVNINDTIWEGFRIDANPEDEELYIRVVGRYLEKQERDYE